MCFKEAVAARDIQSGDFYQITLFTAEHSWDDILNTGAQANSSQIPC